MESRDVGELNKRQEVVPIVALPEGVTKLIREADSKADEIFSLRTRVADFYLHNRWFLPVESETDGKNVPVRQRMDKVLERVNNGEPLSELVNWENGKVPEPKTPFERLLVMTSFKTALDAQGKLSVLESSKFNKDYYRDKYGSFIESKIQLDVFQTQLDDTEAMSDEVASKSFRGELDQSTVNCLQDDIESQKDTLVFQRRKMVEGNPEAFVYYYGMQLKQMKDGLNDGGIIETPYVKLKIERITESVAIGRPVFVHGELGSGKTELVKHISRKYLSKGHLNDWEQKNPKPSKKIELAEWVARRRVEAEPLLISGSRDMTSEQIIGARNIKKGETLAPEDQINLIDSRWQDYIKTCGDQVDTPETKQIFFDSYKEALKSPILVEVTLGPLMKAMQEGRPLIIDEMNAIPHHLLIMMNDLLTRKPGDTITPLVPGSEPFKIREGFCVLATGNYKPEDGVFYVGRQPVDAAFLSRFDLVKYDYLPNNLINEPEGLILEDQRVFRAENELTQMLLVRLLNKDLSGDLPANVFKDVGNLARVARMVQDVFSGVKGKDIPMADDGANQLPASDVLKENVLSIRHLLPILDKWKANGFSKPLDHYIYNEYVSRSDARPKEKAYLYKLMKTVGGFFDDLSGWPALGETQKILNFETGGVFYSKPEVRSFSQVEIIQNLFGEKPELVEVKKKFTDPENYGVGDNEGNEVINDSEFLERVSTLVEAMDVMYIDLGDGAKNYDDFLKVLGDYHDDFLKKFKKTDEQLREVVEAIIEENGHTGDK